MEQLLSFLIICDAYCALIKQEHTHQTVSGYCTTLIHSFISHILKLRVLEFYFFKKKRPPELIAYKHGDDELPLHSSSYSSSLLPVTLHRPRPFADRWAERSFFCIHYLKHYHATAAPYLMRSPSDRLCLRTSAKAALQANRNNVLSS